MIAAVALVFLLLVPGLVTLAAVGTKLRKRMQLDLLESALLACLVGVVIVGWVAFLLAEFGFFSLPLLVLAVVTYSVAVAAFRWRELVSSHLRIWQRLRRDTLLVICLLVLAGVLFLRPFEYVLGGRDPGVYAITGVNIARTGAILVKDTEVANLPMEYRDVLFGEPPEPGMPASRQVGFYLRDLSGTVEPHGFHLFPVWIAILYSLGGLAFALYTTPVFGLLGILALYCLGRRVFNPWVGLLAAFFLTVNAITLWFARYPAAEMLTQFLFLSGMWAFVILLDTPSKPLAIFSGLALGLVHLTKIELFLLPVALFLYLVWLWLRGCFRGEYWYFVVAYLVLLVQALMHAIFIATTYTLNVIFSMAPALLSNTPGATRIDQPHQQILLNLLFVAHWKTTLGILLFMGATLFIASRQRMRIERLISRILRHEAKIRLLGVFIVGLSLVYAYYLRPTLGERHDLPFPLRLFQIGDTASLVKVGWLISPLGILLTGVGLFLIVSQEKKRGLLLLLGYALMETAVLLYGRSITPTYFWAARRDLPVFLPMSMLCTGYALWAFRRHASGALQWIAPSALSLALLAPQVKTSLPFLQHTEYAGASMSLSRLASIFPDDAVLLFDWTGAEHRYAAPMQYLYGRTSFFLPERTIRDPRLSMLVSRWQNEGRPVFWLASDDGSKLRLSGQALVYKTTYTSVLPEAEEVPGRLPARVGESTTVFDVYALVPGMERERKRLASVEIACDQQDGFYRIGNARTDAAPCWTKGSATIKLPAIRGHDLALVLRVGAGRPSGAPHGQTTVFLNDKKLADLLLPNPLHTYTLPIPAELQQSDQWTLRFETASWNPAGAGVSTDDVDFGMMIQSIAIEGR